ncbi:hypothetical protein CAPTEDRAFT_220763 [Capitella teleta]|uniref:Amino acid transporter n=2 Tax=Capitella teleta TaxID=283909 RepID=R7U6C8_CAPTE|nr:hypothetical protein CAPTEDRAFT_220763 [Capitella teleta]|eukprot:ELU01905.1 hypothetical protein CAPTEDRAFT_220763 [Capitella teleta]
MAFRGELFLLLLVFSSVNACEFKVVDLSEFLQLVFDSNSTREVRNDVDCITSCAGLADCAGVAWIEKTRECHILTNRIMTNTLPAYRVILYAEEKFLCGNEFCVDCADAYQSGFTQNGLVIMRLSPPNASPLIYTGFCDMETADKQWLVFQRRVDGSLDFYRGWQSYVQGFGDSQKEFWLGMSHLKSKSSGKLGAAVLTWTFATQIISVIIGIILAILIHPGHDLGGTPPPVKASTAYTDVFGDFLRNIFPDNIIKACLQHAYTIRMKLNVTNGNVTELEQTAKLMYGDGMNVMGVVTFSIFLGIGIQLSGESSKSLKDVFAAMYHVVFKMMDIIIMFSPIGIFSLILSALLDVNDLTGALRSVGLFVLTVFTGLAIHQVIILPLILFVLTRMNPFRVLLHIMDAIIAAFAASAGIVALPIMLHDTQEKLNVDPRVANFSLPIFATINRDGSCLFICVSAIFVAQTYSIAISTGQYFILGLLVTMLSAAVAAVPSTSLVVLLMVSSALNIPVTDRIGLLMATEWLLDRLRATTNIQSNGFGVVVIDHFYKKMMKDGDNEDDDDDEDGVNEKEELFDLV